MPARKRSSSSSSNSSWSSLPPSPKKRKVSKRPSNQNAKRRLKVAKYPLDNYFFDNSVNVNTDDFSTKVEYVEVLTGAGRANRYIFSLGILRTAQKGYVEIPQMQREWMKLAVNDEVDVRPFNFQTSSKTQYLSTVILEVDFYVPESTTKAPSTQEPHAADDMAKDFVLQFYRLPLTVGQHLQYRFGSKTKLSLVVKSLQGTFQNPPPGSQQQRKTTFGKVMTNTIIIFEKAKHSTINLIPKAITSNTSNGQNLNKNENKKLDSTSNGQNLNKNENKKLDSTSNGQNLNKNENKKLESTSNGQNLNKSENKKLDSTKGPPTIFRSDWDFSKLQVGGLDKQFNAIFRRAFASRVVPPELVEKLGLNHVKGILLYGPPGTGKTIMARQIGKMLNARSLKIVNGPELLQKYVGESEQRVRELFLKAENDLKQQGAKSGLHIIIFDEIDAICKKRGSGSDGGTRVNDNIVNQLLTKIDGVDQLNNILLIGMTNRKDLIDEALLRPGRFEIQLEIGLPNEIGRLQILNIHTQRMRDNNKIGSDVDLQELASKTKNYSGAEIAGLVRAAQSTALNRIIKIDSKTEVDAEAANKLRINKDDFMLALKNDVNPAFGKETTAIENYINRGIISWGSAVSSVLEKGRLLIQQARTPDDSGLVSVLFEGPPNAGKSALAAKLALESKFPFIKLCSPDDMIGLNEDKKCKKIRGIFNDAYQSEMSCILIDNVECLLEYSPIGPRFSNLTFQTLYISLKREPPKGRKLLVLCTSSRKSVLEQMEMLTAFTKILNVPHLSKPKHVLCVLQSKCDIFGTVDIETISKRMNGHNISIGIRRLLDIIARTRPIKQENRLGMFFTELEEEGVVGTIL